jgi:hypothetical protein
MSSVYKEFILGFPKTNPTTNVMKRNKNPNTKYRYTGRALDSSFLLLCFQNNNHVLGTKDFILCFQIIKPADKLYA